MKITNIVWRNPDGGLQSATFDPEKHQVREASGLLKIHDKTEGTDILWIPLHKLEVVQFGEKKEESNLARPTFGKEL